MTSLRYTRNLFLRSVCVVYLFAFLSFYYQIPGLYGNNGILPAKIQLEEVKAKTLTAKIQSKPTLLWLAPYIGLDTEYMMDVLAIWGAFLAFTGFISQKFCTTPIFAGLWSLYFCLDQVGQVFSWFQWDSLLLETGFLCLFIAPLRPPSRSRRAGNSSVDQISLWLVRWLLFRVLFSTGVVKLLSNCPKWWDLTALSYYFQSTVLPSPLAWYCFHLPDWFLKITTIYTQLTEVVMPVLFLIPLRSVQITGFFIQLFLQINIVLTANFNFYNFLMIALLLSLLDDQFFYKPPKKQRGSKLISTISTLINLTLHGAILYGAYVLYAISFDGSKLDGKIIFTKDQFMRGLNFGITGSIALGSISLLYAVIASVISLFESNSKRNKTFSSILTTIFFTIAAISIFGISTVPLLKLHPSTNATMKTDLRNIYKHVEPYKIINSYGLFRKMTGLHGRPEIIIEGSNNMEGPWLEYNFLYKPGNVNNSLPFVVPYSPRLDWQMWFAALGTHDQSPWLMSLAYRILNGQPEVLRLLDTQRLPFKNKPPKYLRASLYHYHYTPWTQKNQPTWWTRERSNDYFPIYSKDHGPLLDYLKSIKILPQDSKHKSTVNPIFKSILDYFRYFISQLEGSFFLWSVFAAGCAIIVLSGRHN